MRISVIIANYNYADYIGAAISSALALEWPDVEVIVVDDGSTDDSATVIRSFGTRIIAIFQKNATQRVARNVGFARSTGDAILFLDSDDMVAPSLAQELASVWRPGVSKVQFQMMRVDRDGRPLNSVFPLYNPMPTPEKIFDWVSRTTAYPTPPGSGNIYSREFLNRLFPLDDSCGSATDSACIAAAPFCGKVETIAKPLVYYRVHGMNTSNMLAHPLRFAQVIERAELRYRFSTRFLVDRTDTQVHTDRSLIYKSLPVLQFRVASLRINPAAHPLADDNWCRALVDSIIVPWNFPAETRKVRLLACIWSLSTLIAPLPIARYLISIRYKNK